MTIRWYVLDGHTPVEEPDFLKAAEALDKAGRTVARARVGDAEVSTVFLGLDHGLGGDPVLFETMVFGGPLDDECERYRTWDEAEAGHLRWVARVTEGK